MRGDRYEECVRQLRRDELGRLYWLAATAVAYAWHAAIAHLRGRSRMLAADAATRQSRTSK
jgi:hypothetical protein